MMEDLQQVTYTKGDCFFAQLPGYGTSSVQLGFRPVILMTSQIGLLTSDLVQIVPLTTRQKTKSINPQVSGPFLRGTSYALCSQLQVLPKQALGSKLGHLAPEMVTAIEDGICIALDISRSPSYALNQDREALEALLPRAKDLMKELQLVYNTCVGTLSATHSISTRPLPVSITTPPVSISIPANKAPTETKVSASTFSKDESTKEKRGYRKRTKEEAQSFVNRWEQKDSCKKDVAHFFGFDSETQAKAFYYRARRSIEGNDKKLAKSADDRSTTVITKKSKTVKARKSSSKTNR